MGLSPPSHCTVHTGQVYGATSWYDVGHFCLMLRSLLAEPMKKASPPLLPLRVTIPLPWHLLRVRAIIDLLAVSCNTTTLGPSGTWFPTMASADSRSLAFFRTRYSLADRASRGKTRFFHRTTSGFTVSVLRLPFGLRFVRQPYPPFGLVSSFCS